MVRGRWRWRGDNDAMIWKQGLIRICIVATVIWIVVVASALWMGCFASPLSPICDVAADWLGVPVDKAVSEFGFTDWFSWTGFAAWPPLAIITLAYAVSWLLRGFESKSPKKGVK